MNGGLQTVSHLGLDCLLLAVGDLEILVTRSVGPRILGLRPAGGENVFAELPDLTLDLPGGKVYHLYGGHRLWHAPEVPARTYIPDDQPVEVTPIDGGLRIDQSAERQTGIQKRMQLRFPDQKGTLIVEHLLTNQGLWPVSCAPWAITMLRPGGVAILPQHQDPVDADGVQPNRSLVLWPYSDLTIPHVRWCNRYVLVRAGLTSGAFKVGLPNRRGWLAYYWQDLLFVKYAEFFDGAHYYDMGASSQCYVHPRFLELETLGPHRELGLGETVLHQEVWRVVTGLEQGLSDEALIDLVDEMELERFER
jgi:hypothetical protein